MDIEDSGDLIKNIISENNFRKKPKRKKAIQKEINPKKPSKKFPKK